MWRCPLDANRTATAIAHSNIALAKYWGKRSGRGNYPAVPSLSVTLAGLSTRTTVTFDRSLQRDELVLDGIEASHATLGRTAALLHAVRESARSATYARVTSANDFPTASGLASSASGFAALALAATTAAGLDWSAERVSDLARRASASAARSLFGGFVELAEGPNAPTGDEILSARQVAPASHLDLAVLVCITTEAPKSVASTAGMLETQKKSPYWSAWRGEASRLCTCIREALLRRDFHALGELSESSALAMHACAMAAGVVYVSGSTLDVIARVRSLRNEGVGAYATMDAGPHVKVLVEGKDVERARAQLAQLPAVKRILEARPGEGARVIT